MFIVHFGLSLWLPLSFTTSLILQVVRGVQAPQLTSWVDTASSFLFPILFVFPPVVPSQVSNTVFLFAVTKKKQLLSFSSVCFLGSFFYQLVSDFIGCLSCFSNPISLPSAPHRKNSPSLPNANSSNRGDQGRRRAALRQISSQPISKSSYSCRLCPFMNSHLNAIERKPNCVFTMCMTSFFVCLAPISPFPFLFYFFIWLHSNSKREVT